MKTTLRRRTLPVRTPWPWVAAAVCLLAGTAFAAPTMMTDAQMESGVGFAAKIGAVTDPARPLTIRRSSDE